MKTRQGSGLLLPMYLDMGSPSCGADPTEDLSVLEADRAESAVAAAAAAAAPRRPGDVFFPFFF